MTLYAVTIFLSAFLLFQVQPLIAKMILPWFGGSAAVWSASMLFFQLLLLAGYAYAHISIRFLKPRVQMLVHVTLLLASCALLPILPSPAWRPTQVGDPTARILMLLTATIGLPYFLLSSTSPLHLDRTNIESSWTLDVVQFQISGLMDLLYLPKRKRVARLTAD